MLKTKMRKQELEFDCLHQYFFSITHCLFNNYKLMISMLKNIKLLKNVVINVKLCYSFCVLSLVQNFDFLF